MSLQRRLASQSTVIFGARLGGAGLIFVAQALIARVWGADLLGEYLVVMATVNLVAMVMPLGFSTVGTYFTAEYRARGERKQLWVFVRQAYGHVLGALVVLLLGGPIVLNLFGLGDGAVAHHFVPMALMAFAAANVFVSGAILVGVKRPFAGFFADAIFRPMLVIGAFLGIMGWATPADGLRLMMWAIAIGFVVVSLIQVAVTLYSLRSVLDVGPARVGESRRWWRFALPWVLISLATDFFFDIDLLLLSQVLSREELAVFGICTRLFSLISFGVAAVYAVTLPDMFESEANEDRAAFKRKVGDANFVASVISVALFVGMLLAAPFLLMIFGPSFSAGAAPLAVLCLALVIRSMAGPASLVLSIHDRPYASLPFMALGIVTLVIGNWLLVPSFGLMGAALSAIIAISVWSVGLWWVALRTAHMDVSIMQWFRNRRAVVVAAE
ncbi:Membrane protein involved in the export of O-antigen and teichoic acid [Devosia sp. YR412]|uniref:lipopolysaccharide biosynthesis protein n=1 Tax=Devosia sp. YR412 TaxID=1881030 RepID=UPI0008B4C11C|nr:polysaccharide biosynthesis C-terminal domain-containing protein [Devosia sp. YR412]SEP99701.1 Membrane protein involved in the export of O-antigen and teichoic acid [Devosia sp. YR412]